MELTGQPGASGDAGLPRVQSVVAARLALLSEEARAAAEVASAVGRDFRFDILAQASDLEEDALVRALDELWRRHIVRVQADERWDFSHDRIREVAYSAIGPARRRLIHRRIAQGMELLFANRLDEVSASIAVHLDRGGQPARAIPFLERAAAVATRVSANEEAIRCLTHALSLLEMLPAGRDRDERELALRSSLSVALNSARGYAAPDVEQNLNRVLTLSRADGTGRGARALAVGGVHAPLHARRLERHARGSGAGARAQRIRSVVPLRGASRDGRHVVERGRARRLAPSLRGGPDGIRRAASAALRPGLGPWRLCARVVRARALAARRRDAPRSRRSNRQSRWQGGSITCIARPSRSHTPALLHQMRRDTDQVLECGEAVVALCERYGFAYYGDWAQVLIGWARGQERPAEGVEMIESALAGLDAQRAQARRPYYLSLLAETYSLLGNRDRAASILDAAITMALERADVWWLPALYLQKSELEPPPERDATRRRGLELARAQNSQGLERRILASSIARST